MPWLDTAIPRIVGIVAMTVIAGLGKWMAFYVLGVRCKPFQYEAVASSDWFLLTAEKKLYA